MTSDLWAICCYFNPVNFQTKIVNYRHFRSGLAAHGIPLLTVELTREGEAPNLTSDDAEIHIHVTSDSALWHKERLFNLGARRLPESCKAILFSDADILFTSPTFKESIQQAMERVPVAQAFSRFVRLPKGSTSIDPEICPYRYEEDGAMIVGAGKNWQVHGSRVFELPELFGFPGGAWVMRKELAQTIGWYDRAILGGGDVLFFLGAVGGSEAPQRQAMTPEQAAHYHAWAQTISNVVQGAVSYVPGDALHLWHGAPQNRGYGVRSHILQKHSFDPISDLSADGDRPLMWASDKSALHRDVFEYFRGRQEDTAWDTEASQQAREAREMRELIKHPSICIVANMLDYVDATCGIGSYNLLLARLLTRDGWRVTILYAGDCESNTSFADLKSMLDRESIEIRDVGEFGPDIPKRRKDRAYESSRMIDRALQVLNDERKFDIVEISDWNAPGFLTVQRNRYKGNIKNLVLRLHGPSSWGRLQNKAHPISWHKISTEYMEQQACEAAPYLLAPSRYIIDFYRDYGWHLPQAEVLTLPMPAKEQDTPSSPIDEVVFFGRIEERKGADLFIAAVESLPPGIKITFIGPYGLIKSLKLPKTVPPTLLQAREYKVITNFDRAAALEYLGTGSRLAVIPSRAETFGYTVVECAINRIPFLVGRYGALCDVLRDDGLIDDIGFELDSKSLRQKIDQYLAADLQTRGAWIDRAQKATWPLSRESEILARYREIAERRSTAAEAVDVSQVPVTVGFAVQGCDYKLARASLLSIKSQVHQNLEILVCADEGDATRIQDTIRRLVEEFPGVRVVMRDDLGAHNSMLEHASSPYYLPFSSLHEAKPWLVRSLVEVADSNRNLAAVSCHATVMIQRADGVQYKLHDFEPAGGPISQAGFEQNVLGELPSLFRTRILRDIGGFSDVRHTFEGWRLFLRLRNLGHATAVYPFNLLKMTVEESSWTRSGHRESKEYILREFVSKDTNAAFMEEYLRQMISEPMPMATPSLPPQRHGRPQRKIGHEMADKVDDFLRQFPRSRALLRKSLLKLTSPWIRP